LTPEFVLPLPCRRRGFQALLRLGLERIQLLNRLLGEVFLPAHPAECPVEAVAGLGAVAKLLMAQGQEEQD
jgi:hypothetical protein